MALFKRNDNKDQAAEDLAENQAEGMAEDSAERQAEHQPEAAPQDVPATNAEDPTSTDPAPRKRFGKSKPKRKPKRDLSGVVRNEEL